MRVSETGFGVFVASAGPWMAAAVVVTAALIICLWRGGVLDTPATRDPSRWLIGRGSLGRSERFACSSLRCRCRSLHDLGKARELREAVASRSDINDTLTESLFDDPALEVRAAAAANHQIRCGSGESRHRHCTDVRAAAAATRQPRLRRSLCWRRIPNT